MAKFDREKLRSAPVLSGLALLILLGIAFSGCAGSKAIQTERMLAASGFQMKLADTPEKLQHIQTLTQRKIVTHKKDGKAFFVYADDKNCKCVYVGDENAYQEYEDRFLQKQQADEDLMAAEVNSNSSMNWGMWGPWRPWY